MVQRYLYVESVTMHDDMKFQLMTAIRENRNKPAHHERFLACFHIAKHGAQCWWGPSEARVERYRGELEEPHVETSTGSQIQNDADDKEENRVFCHIMWGQNKKEGNHAADDEDSHTVQATSEDNIACCPGASYAFQGNLPWSR